MNIEKAIKEIEKITKRERLISLEQLDEIKLIENVKTENCGLSGTGKGTLVTIYYGDIFADISEDDIEIAEVVILE